jgi:glycosyltransferase involved in cell wall biosynthesis
MPKVRLGIYDLGYGGGTTRYLNDLLTGLPAERFEIVFFPPNTATRQAFGQRDTAASGQELPTAPVAAPPRSVAGKLWRCAPHSLRLSVGLGREIRRLRQQIRAARLDIFHSNYTGFEFATLAARLAGVKRIVATYHGLPTEAPANPWLESFFENVGSRCCRRPIAVTEGARRAWEERCRSLRGRFRLIYYGIDAAAVQQAAAVPLTRTQLDLPEDAPVLAVVARLHPMKGIPYLLEAMPQIVQAQPQTRLLLLGDGPDRAALEQQSRAAGLEKSVRFLGWRTDVVKIVPVCDVVVLPSIHTETFGYALADAMALGKPVVGTDVGGVPELVAHNQTGFIVPKRNPAALAQAILALLNNPARARQFGAAGRTRVEQHFPLERMRRETLAVYEELLQLA